MKRIVTLATLLVAAGFSYTSYASAQETTIRAKVPFDFAVGNHVMPSGEYRIAAQGNALVIENRDQRAHLFMVGEPGDSSTNGKNTLTFDVVQGQYFLRKIASTSASTSAEFPVSKLEKRSRELALQQAKSPDLAQTVTVNAEIASR
jgi:hypothetical protein